MGNPVRQVKGADQSSGDTCGFILHVLIVLVTIASCFYFSLPQPSFVVIDEDSYAKQVWDLFPDRSIVALIIRSLLVALAATSLVYFVVNTLSVPTFDSVDALCVDYTTTDINIKESNMSNSTPR